MELSSILKRLAKRLAKAVDFVPSLKRAKNHTRGRGVDVIGHTVERSVKIVSRMLDEFRYDEASVFLFNLNKLHPEEWKLVSDQLLSVVSRSQLAALATIIDCSSRQELSSCNALIPGLSQYTAGIEDPELFD